MLRAPSAGLGAYMPGLLQECGLESAALALVGPGAFSFGVHLLHEGVVSFG